MEASLEAIYSEKPTNQVAPTTGKVPVAQKVQPIWQPTWKMKIKQIINTLDGSEIRLTSWGW